MGINIKDIENMMLSIRDNKAPHNKDIKAWIEAAMYRYTTADIKLHEVQLLEHVHAFDIQNRLERVRIYIVIANARARGYLD